MGLMLRVAVRPRFLGLLALMIAATVVCGLLASWQWDRAHRAITGRAAAEQSVDPLRDVLDVGDAVTNDIVGRTVQTPGTFVTDEQVVVPDRRIEDTDAVIVVTALQVEQSDGSTARMPVARGWVPREDVTAPDGSIDPSLAPPPPEGEVDVSGRIEAAEAASTGVRDGVAGEIATSLLVNEWGDPMYTGYIAESGEESGLQPMPAAESEFSRGLDWQNIGYSLQWVLFGGFFLYLWWRSVRTAYHDELELQRQELQAEVDALASDPSDSDPSPMTVGASGPDPTDKD